MPLKIRKATPKDSQTIFNFIMELAIYEKAEQEVKTNVEETREAIFGKNSTVKALICEEDGKPIGYAVYFYNYSTWLGKNGIYLEDLYLNLLVALLYKYLSNKIFFYFVQKQDLNLLKHLQHLMFYQKLLSILDP